MKEKLVRDNIPEIIKASGKKCTYRIADSEEYHNFLIDKLDEEVAEYKESGELEELADIMEVLLGLTIEMGLSENDLIDICQKKRKERGAFQEKYVISL